jgi:hypothetical protein
VTESEFQDQVIEWAVFRGWKVQHQRPARVIRNGRESWRTTIQGHKGAPDLLLARKGVVIHAELKTDKGKLSPEQESWRDSMGETWRLWRPSDWPAIERELM